MKPLNRRRWLTAGLSTAGLGAAYTLAARTGLRPPDQAGPYGPGASLTYAAHRLLGRHANAREFPRHLISATPFANPVEPLGAAFQRHQAAGFRDWRLTVDGLVASPASYSLDDLKRLPASTQITQLACEEGWSYIAEWTGAPLSELLRAAGARPEARFVVYRSFQSDWWDSLDIDEATHPQTLISYGMNGADLPVAHGGPLRLRAPRQLGYKNIKFIHHLTVAASLDGFGKGRGSASAEFGYSWYTGI
jgi:DMSO/TMAO reductase YedYZ molybdopterin-dependent catalytic subunit